MKTPVSLYDALLMAHVPAEKARAVADALETDMTSALASKQDLESLGLLLRAEIRQTGDALRTELRAEIRESADTLRAEIRQSGDALRVEWRKDIETAVATLTVRLVTAFGGMLATGLGLLFAALKLTS